MVIVSTELLEYPNDQQFHIIHRDLNISLEEFEKNEVLFHEWLYEQKHLPKEYNKHLAKNFLRMCKNNLDKAKMKFENYIIAKSTLPEIFQNRCLDDDSLKDSLSHRCLSVIPQLTKDCYRIIFLKIPKDNMTSDNFHECVKYVLLNADFGLSNTAEGGHICVIDCKGFSISSMRQISLSVIKRTIYLVVKVYPSRLREIHLLNINRLVSGTISLIKVFLPEKLKRRIRIHDSTTSLMECFPSNLIPSDYGGTAISSDDNSECWRRFFIQNTDWIERHDKMGLLEVNVD